MTPGVIDRRELYKSLIEAHHWTPRQIAKEITIPQLWAIWIGEPEREKRVSFGSFKEMILYVKERKRKEAEAKENGG